MSDLDRRFAEPFWQRLEEHERGQFRDYVSLLLQDPEAICDAFNPNRRREFTRLLATGLGFPQPREGSTA
jgi:hypothetical protein